MRFKSRQNSSEFLFFVTISGFGYSLCLRTGQSNISKKMPYNFIIGSCINLVHFQKWNHPGQHVPDSLGFTPVFKSMESGGL